MKTQPFIAAFLFSFCLLQSCDNNKAEDAQQVAEARRTEKIRVLKKMDADAKTAREKASTGTVPTPKPFENLLLK